MKSLFSVSPLPGRLLLSPALASDKKSLLGLTDVLNHSIVVWACDPVVQMV